MKYTTESLRNLAKKNNTTVLGLSKMAGISLNTMYRYCKWNEKDNHSKRAITEKKKFDNKLSSFMKDKEEKTITKEDSGKYIEVALSNAEEICYQLSQGIEVFQECSNDTLKLVEGIIVRFRNGKPVFINCAISLDEKYYIKVLKPITVEIGKKYLTRSGEETIVVSGRNVFKAVVIGDGFCFVVDEAGKSTNGEPQYDLVEEIDD